MTMGYSESDVNGRKVTMDLTPQSKRDKEARLNAAKELMAPPKFSSMKAMQVMLI